MLGLNETVDHFAMAHSMPCVQEREWSCILSLPTKIEEVREEGKGHG